MPDPINPISIVDGDTHINKYTGKKIYIGGNEYLPVGTVLMYNGSGIADVGSRSTPLGDESGDTIDMPGWYVCNGNASTPNLLNKFVRAEAASGNTGGSDTCAHTHSAGSYIGPWHGHTLGGAWVSVSSVASAIYWQTAYARGGFTANWGTQSGVVSGSWWVSGTAVHGNTDGGGNGSVTGTSGGASNTENRPAYYSLIFIIRMA